MKPCSRLLAAFLVLWGSANPLLAQTKLLKLDGRPQPIRGINLAWLNGSYGHDFGRSQEHPDWGVAFENEKDQADLNAYFADMARMNLNVVRIFVFEDLEGIEFENGYASKVSDQIRNNFHKVVDLATKHHLHVYFCLANNYNAICRNMGYPQVISDLKARKAYLNNVVRPFVHQFKGNSTVFAYDIENEPEQEVAGNEGN